jgi:hypothetical protein
MSTLFWLSILLCLIIGAAIQTSEICLCRASTDLTVGKPAMALGLLLVTVAASVVFYITTVFAWHQRPPSWSYPTWLTLVGAAMFALGTVLNDACTVGTIGRVARGDIGHLATFAGALVVALLLPSGQGPSMSPTPPPVSGLGWLAVILAGAGVVILLGRSHLSGIKLRSYLLLGLVGAIVTDWAGNATWLGVFQHLEASFHLQAAAFAGIAVIVVGAMIMAVFRGQFQILRPRPLTMLREFIGGGLMIGGATLIPGANFTLSVYGVPSGNPNAVVGYLLMFVLMLAMLRAKRTYSQRSTQWGET